ncbi:MAG: TIGR02444 family protein [Alphaproteobacteria bacterium]|nr:TIGR02444 family protein [Alphaproteobacteria bacterium]
MTVLAAADFWQFSLAFYAQSGVAPACLALQDRHGLDVNLALYCCWLGLSGRGRIDASRLIAADTAIASWRREIIEPLRAVHRGLRQAAEVDPDSKALHERVKALELEAECICQTRLAALAPPAVASNAARCLDDACASLGTYLGSASADGAPLFGALKTFAGRAA